MKKREQAKNEGRAAGECSPCRGHQGSSADLQAGPSPPPWGPHGATGHTCHCIRDSHNQGRGKEQRRRPGKKSPGQKVSREKEHRTIQELVCDAPREDWRDKADLR